MNMSGPFSYKESFPPYLGTVYVHQETSFNNSSLGTYYDYSSTVASNLMTPMAAEKIEGISDRDTVRSKSKTQRREIRKMWRKALREAERKVMEAQERWTNQLELESNLDVNREEEKTDRQGREIGGDVFKQGKMESCFLHLDRSSG